LLRFNYPFSLDHNEFAKQALAGVEATLARLYVGKVGWVLGGFKRMKAASEEAAEAISNCWDYLYAHRDRTHYRQLRRGGDPIGSGGIESFNECICHVRLKRSGTCGQPSDNPLRLWHSPCLL
jgi:hypothetical protein